MKTKLALAKKSILLLVFAVLLALTFGLTACGSEEKTEYAVEIESVAFELEKGASQKLDFTLTKNGVADETLKAVVTVTGDSVTWSAETGEITAVQGGTSTVTVAIEGHEDAKKEISVNVPKYTIEFASSAVTVSEGETVAASYTVKKNGATVNDKKVSLTVQGDAITVNSLKKQVTAVKAGSATLTATLEDDETVTASVTYTVKGVFFSRDAELKRGTIDFSREENGVVDILGGQATVLCKTDDTKFVFKTTLEIKDNVLTSQSFGVGAFRDNGDNALWFGAKGTGTDGVYSVYIRNFLDGWGSPKYDAPVANYSNYRFGTTIEFAIVRDGDDYWYSIGGLSGTFRDEHGLFTDEPMFPGIYSQEKTVTVTNFTVSYEQSDVDAAKALYGAAVSKLSINEKNVNLLEKGARYTYTASVYSAAALTEPVVWEIDKSEMTAGADETSFNNGALALSNDAAGYITVKVSCGGKEDSVRIEISAEELSKQTDVVAVSGGVELDLETSKVTFSEERNFNNETLELTQYKEIPYMAKLLATVTGNFTLEFKVKNYKSTASTPMLLVSLGGVGNNFVITDSNVQSYTYRIGSDNSYAYGMQNGSAFTSFDALAEHAYKIVVADGKYTVTVDGAPVNFDLQPIRRVEDFIAECNIMFATNAGTSCEVYDFAITEGAASGAYYQVNNNSVLTDNGFTLNFTSDSWASKDNHITRLYYLPALPAEFHLALNVTFSAAMTDSKFVVQFGDYEFHVNNKGTLQGQLYGGSWGNAPSGTTAYNATETTKVVVERAGGKANFYIGETLIASLSNAPADTLLSFYTFNEKTEEASATVTVSGLTVSKAFVTNLLGASQIKAGESAAYTAEAYGTEDIPVWSLDTAGLTAGTATMENGTVAVSADAAGTVVVKVTLAGIELTKTVAIQKMIPVVTSQNAALSNVTETGFTLTSGVNTEWDLGVENVAVYKDAVPSGNWEMTFNLSLSAMMTDSKLCIRFGGGSNFFTICICNGSYKVEVRNVWGGVSVSDWDISNIAVKIVCTGGVASCIINDSYTCNGTTNVESGNRIDFYTFNGSSAEAGTLFTVSALTLTAK